IFKVIAFMVFLLSVLLLFFHSTPLRAVRPSRPAVDKRPRAHHNKGICMEKARGAAARPHARSQEGRGRPRPSSPGEEAPRPPTRGKRFSRKEVAPLCVLPIPCGSA